MWILAAMGGVEGFSRQNFQLRDVFELIVRAPDPGVDEDPRGVPEARVEGNLDLVGVASRGAFRFGEQLRHSSQRRVQAAAVVPMTAGTVSDDEPFDYRCPRNTGVAEADARDFQLIARRSLIEPPFVLTLEFVD